MSLNKKGVTITEIIVSVALISLVIIMVIQILVDIRYEDNYTKNKGVNMVNQALLIKNVQDDLTNKTLTDIACEISRTRITFYFSNGDIRRLTKVSATEYSYNNEIFTVGPNTEYKNSVAFDRVVSTVGLNQGKIVIPVADKQDNHFDIEIFFIYPSSVNVGSGC